MLNLYGNGYIGSNYAKMYDCIVNDRNDLSPKTNNILYMISTTSNYTVLENPYIDIETNLLTLIKVLEQCKGKNITFNFISSWFVYGQKISPVDENSICEPKGFYSITKRTAEQLLISYCNLFDIKYRILRLANVVGGQDLSASSKKNALSFLIQKISKNEDIILENNGLIIRDYIHVNDVCRAINIAVSKGEINTIYNIGNGRPILLKDLIDYAKVISQSKSKITNMPLINKEFYIDPMWMNCNKIFKLGYQSQYNEYQIVDELLKTYR